MASKIRRKIAASYLKKALKKQSSSWSKRVFVKKELDRIDESISEIEKIVEGFGEELKKAEKAKLENDVEEIKKEIGKWAMLGSLNVLLKDLEKKDSAHVVAMAKEERDRIKKIARKIAGKKVK